jgi:hypothetical protein
LKINSKILEAVVFRKNENEDTEILLNSKTDNSATRDRWPSIKGPLFSNYIYQVFNWEKIFDMQHIRDDQNIYERIYNDGWEKICRKDYLKYVKLAFEPSCTHLDIQFSVCI